MLLHYETELAFNTVRRILYRILGVYYTFNCEFIVPKVTLADAAAAWSLPDLETRTQLVE